MLLCRIEVARLRCIPADSLGQAGLACAIHGAGAGGQRLRIGVQGPAARADGFLSLGQLLQQKRALLLVLGELESLTATLHRHFVGVHAHGLLGGGARLFPCALTIAGTSKMVRQRLRRDVLAPGESLREPPMQILAPLVLAALRQSLAQQCVRNGERRPRRTRGLGALLHQAAHGQACQSPFHLPGLRREHGGQFGGGHRAGSDGQGLQEACIVLRQPRHSML